MSLVDSKRKQSQLGTQRSTSSSSSLPEMPGAWYSSSLLPTPTADTGSGAAPSFSRASSRAAAACEA